MQIYRESKGTGTADHYKRYGSLDGIEDILIYGFQLSQADPDYEHSERNGEDDLDEVLGDGFQHYL